MLCVLTTRDWSKKFLFVLLFTMRTVFCFIYLTNFNGVTTSRVTWSFQGLRSRNLVPLFQKPLLPHEAVFTDFSTSRGFFISLKQSFVRENKPSCISTMLDSRKRHSVKSNLIKISLFYNVGNTSSSFDIGALQLITTYRQ